MQLLRDFYMSLSCDITPSDLTDYIFLFEVIIFWQESQAKNLMKVIQMPYVMKYQKAQGTECNRKNTDI